MYMLSEWLYLQYFPTPHFAWNLANFSTSVHCYRVYEFWIILGFAYFKNHSLPVFIWVIPNYLISLAMEASACTDSWLSLPQ